MFILTISKQDSFSIDANDKCLLITTKYEREKHCRTRINR